jgi:hypothetical protein
MPLADPEIQNAEDRLTQVYEWCFDRTMTLARLAFATAGAVLLALATSLVQGDHPTPWQIGALSGTTILFTVFGLVLMSRLRRLHVEFTKNLRLLMRSRRLLALIAASAP